MSGLSTGKSGLPIIIIMFLVVLCEHERNNFDPADPVSLLLYDHFSSSLRWTKEEGYWRGWGHVSQNFDWTWIFAQQGRHIHWRLKGREVLALLDHHHFHLHLHLLHHHIHRRQYPLHCSGIQYLWIDKKKVVISQCRKIFTQMVPFIISVNSVHRFLYLYLVSSLLSHSVVWHFLCAFHTWYSWPPCWLLQVTDSRDLNPAPK